MGPAASGTFLFVKVSVSIWFYGQKKSTAGIYACFTVD